MLHGVIMAGGSGTRFWPASRKHYPKQFLHLCGNRSMLQATRERLLSVCDPNHILIVTNQLLVPIVQQQLPQLLPEAVIGEPAKRDTAPCIGLAAEWLLATDPDAIMLVAPADHVISPDDLFSSSVRQAVELVDRDPSRIVTFGIKPTYPAQVFGYVERGQPISGDLKSPTFNVARFREKPDAATAQEFFESGRFYWNSGIFVWKARTISDALAKFEPTIHAQIKKIISARGRADFDEVFSREFTAIQGLSIDFAVMEKYQPVLVIEAPFEWDDVGNWSAVPRVSGVDDKGNAVRGKHLLLETQNCIVRSTDEHLLVTFGIQDLVIVHTPDATLIANRHDEASVKRVVEQLEQLGWDEFL